MSVIIIGTIETSLLIILLLIHKLLAWHIFLHLAFHLAIFVCAFTLDAAVFIILRC